MHELIPPARFLGTWAAMSTHYEWPLLWWLLAGLFALTFAVFIVAPPTVATQFHSNVTALTWTMVGPHLAYGLAAPLLSKTGDIFGHRRLYLLVLFGDMVSAALTALSHSVDMLLFVRALDGVQGAATGMVSRRWGGGVSWAREVRSSEYHSACRLSRPTAGVPSFDSN